MTKDLYTGAHLSSTGQSYSLSLVTPVLFTTHLNIPMTSVAPALNVTSMTSTPVLESMNRYNVLMDNNKMPTTTGAAIPRIAQLAKRSVSNLS